MSYRSNKPGTSLTAGQLAALDSFVSLTTTPAGQHLAKDAGGNFVNTPDTGGGGGTPGGLTTQLQYNNAGAFGGISGATTNGTLVTFLSTGIELADATTNTKKVNFNLASITAATTRTLTVQDVTGTLALLSNHLGQFGATTSAQLAAVISDETGTGALVFANTPTLVTPVLGVATATSINKVSFTQPATGSTLTILDGKTLTVNNTMTFAGTDSRVYTFPTTNATIARTDAGQTFTGVNTFTSPRIITSIDDTNGLSVLIISPTASAVNQITVANAATGGSPSITASGTDANINLNISAKGTGAIKHVDATFQDIVTATDGATVTFDMSLGNLQQVTLGGNRTLALSNVKVGQVFMLRIVQDATGTRVPTWFTTIKWAGGTAPTLTTTANKVDILGFICTSAGNYDGFVVGQNI